MSCSRLSCLHFSGTLGAPQRGAPALGSDASLLRTRAVNKNVFLIKEPGAQTMPARHPQRPSKSQPSQPLRLAKINIRSKSRQGHLKEGVLK
jgi:hypothetical protein